MWRWVVVAASAVLLAAACSDGDPRPAPDVAPTATISASPDATVEVVSQPRRKTYARGETVDIESGVLFLDPKTGGGEAWEGVRPSPSGKFVAWYGVDQRQPPVLIETATHREIQLQTAGKSGAVLDYSPDDSEVSLRVDNEMLIASTGTGQVRLRFPLDPATHFVRAAWGPAGAVAVGSMTRDGGALGFIIWRNDAFLEFPDAPGANWGQFTRDGRRFATSRPGEGGWTAIIDLGSRTVRRIEVGLQNPRWSESGEFLSGQDAEGRVWIHRADGARHMRIDGACVLLGPVWFGNELPAWDSGENVLVAMDGSSRPYVVGPPGTAVSTFEQDGVALWDRLDGNRLAQLKLPPEGKISISWPATGEGVHGTTADGRGMFLLGIGGRGWCEGARDFNVELPPFAN